MKDVIIIGGGIAGLTTAHELLNKNYNVTLFENNPIVGGLARTYQNEMNKICPYEYSWRAFGKWYQNVYQLMKQIPYNEKENVYDKLTILQGGKKTCNKNIPSYDNTLKQIPLSDYIKLIPFILDYFSSCDKRNIENYSGLSLKKYIQENKFSKKAEDVFGKIVGPYLGFDYHHASVYDLFYGFEMMQNNSDEKNNFNILSLPTNHAWFEPWLRYLKKKGLKLYTNTSIEKIYLNQNNSNIDYILAFIRDLNKKQIFKADYYVNCTGPDILYKFFKPYLMYNIQKPFRNWIIDIGKVAKNGRQIQLSIYYYLNIKIYLDNENTLAYLPNTPWLLMVLPTGHIWGDKYLSKYCESEIKEVVSVGICEPYVEGLLIKKPWSKCTNEEIMIESWYQLTHDKDFINNICTEDNIPLKDIKVIDFKMWDSYVYKNGRIDTYEPKWGNNINTKEYRPDSVSPIENLFIGGAYTDTSTGIFSMESAAESGKKAALSLIRRDNNNGNIYIHTKEKFSFNTIIKKIDCFLMKYNLSYFKIIFVIIFSFIIYYLFKKIKI